MKKQTEVNTNAISKTIIINYSSDFLNEKIQYYETYS